VIFAQRESREEPAYGPAEAAVYDSYLEQTARYRESFLPTLCAAAQGGPVLEVNDGFGHTSRALAESAGLRAVGACRNAWGLPLLRAKQQRVPAGGSPILRCEEEDLPFGDGTFALVYSEGRLRRWRRPLAVVAELLRVTREGGALVLHDLRRDADPFVTEMLVRELAAQPGDDSRFLLRHLVASLESAYAADEVASFLREGGFPPFELDDHNEMTLTVTLRKPGCES
jgi:SAM-dependent methyltransferase